MATVRSVPDTHKPHAVIGILDDFRLQRVTEIIFLMQETHRPIRTRRVSGGVQVCIRSLPETGEMSIDNLMCQTLTYSI